MAQLISEIWAGLREAGLPEVMLYLPDQSASRCHWDDTTLIGDIRVALLADQDRQIVRILPVDSCAGIGIASPKGVDPSGYKTVVYKKLRKQFGGPSGAEEETQEEERAHDAEVAAAAAASLAQPPPVVYAEAEPTPPEKADPLLSRWGMAPRTTAGAGRPGAAPYGGR